MRRCFCSSQRCCARSCSFNMVGDVAADAASQVLQTPPQPCRRRSIVAVATCAQMWCVRSLQVARALYAVLVFHELIPIHQVGQHSSILLFAVSSAFCARSILVVSTSRLLRVTCYCARRTTHVPITALIHSTGWTSVLFSPFQFWAYRHTHLSHYIECRYAHGASCLPRHGACNVRFA